MYFKNSLNNTIQLISSAKQTEMKMTLREEIARSIILLQWNTTIPQRNKGISDKCWTHKSYTQREEAENLHWITRPNWPVAVLTVTPSLLCKERSLLLPLPESFYTCSIPAEFLNLFHVISTERREIGSKRWPGGQIFSWCNLPSLK